MKVVICAVGRLRACPESEIADSYLRKFNRAASPMGVGPASIREVEARNGGGRKGEAELLSNKIPKGSVLCALDERGKNLSSPEFAELISKWRYDGRSTAAFLVGGADGLHSSLIDGSNFSISFGRMVFPHALARAMLAEQLYRAATILNGSPYHRY
ncbi:MAG: 23S rRNA (pseudouridine(1915)-N(3))-methyltransferase RlmH [Albidovulum sp.]|nr:23S rRNA (pseudouridine(1915)-N(3))-methyltransferase RlmH [Albidovulum sp.]MDE0531782.1 23S rRNA (pseudouridine(1915)-N(3))-methyltransferase RlmH [Albidovulum sp.]